MMIFRSEALCRTILPSTLAPPTKRPAELQGLVARDEQHLLESGDRIADVAGELLDLELAASGDSVLLSARLDHRVATSSEPFVSGRPC